MKMYAVCISFVLISLSTAIAQSEDLPDQQANSDWQHKFQLSSTTFTDGGQLPLTMVLGPTYCNYVSGGSDESPQLTWTHAPWGTRSFVVTMYDVTAAFTHWGMYNISPKTTNLPENAGTATSTDGQQIFNDFYLGGRIRRSVSAELPYAVRPRLCCYRVRSRHLPELALVAAEFPRKCRDIVSRNVRPCAGKRKHSRVFFERRLGTVLTVASSLARCRLGGRRAGLLAALYLGDVAVMLASDLPHLFLWTDSCRNQAIALI